MVLPVKLSGHTMTPAGQIHPISMSQSWRTDGLSSCTITMRIDDEIQLALGDWVLVTSPHGHMSGVFYVKNLKTNYVTTQITITLEHTFGLLQEAVAFGEITPETIGGTGVTTTNINAAINYMLNFQTERLWNLYQNDYPDISQGWKFTHQDVYSALGTIMENVPDCQWEFDQTSLPWKVSLKAFPATAIMEMRMSRNIESMTVTLDRSQMYTRVYPTGKKNLHIDSVNGGSSYLEKNTAIWGVISQVLTDSTIDSAALLKNWAQTNLDKHSVPSVSVSIGGIELSEATGEPLDALQIGRLCRIPLPEYSMTVTERIVELTWNNCVLSEDQVQVTLADELKTIQGVLYQLTKSGHSGKKGSTSKDCDLEEHEEKLEEFDNSDIWVNRDSVWAVCGRYDVYTDENGKVHLRIKDGGFLEVQRDGVYETVGTSQAITEVDNKVTNTIMGSALWTQRNNITGVVGEFQVVEETDPDTGQTVRHLKIISGGGMTIQRNQTEFGLWDKGNLDGGVMVNRINDDEVEVQIKAARVNLGAYATVGQLNAVSAEIQNLTGGTIVENYVGAQLVVGTTVTANNTFVHDGDTIYKRAMRWTSGGSVIATVHALGDTSSIILNHSHAMTVDSDGAVTVGDAQTSSGTFNIADTAFHKARVASAWNSGGATAFADKSSQYAPYGGSVVINIKYKDHDGHEQNTGRSVTIWNTDCSHTFKEQTFTSNGTYYASSTGYSGYSKVVISVRTTKHSKCADSLTKSGTHALMYVPDSSGITISAKVKNISNASRVWYYRDSDQDLFTAYT